jgi:hypothetical protein
VYLIGRRQHLAVLCLLPGSSLAQLCARLMVWQQRLIAYYTASGICCLAYPVTLPAVYKVAWRCAGERVAECQRQHSGITAPQQSRCDHCKSQQQLRRGQECMPGDAGCSMQRGVRDSAFKFKQATYPPWCMSQVHPDSSNVRNFALAVKSE